MVGGGMLSGKGGRGLKSLLIEAAVGGRGDASGMTGSAAMSLRLNIRGVLGRPWGASSPSGSLGGVSAGCEKGGAVDASPRGCAVAVTEVGAGGVTEEEEEEAATGMVNGLGKLTRAGMEG